MDYPGYVPGPSTPLVPFILHPVNGGDDRLNQIDPRWGLPKVTNIVSTVAVPGTVGAFAPIVLGVTTRIG